MASDKWVQFPYDQDDYDYSGGSLREHWDRLHRGDCEPFPDSEFIARLCTASPGLVESLADFEGDHAAIAEHLQAAWRAYHRGDFQKAVDRGLELGTIGYNVANKAAGIYADYLEEDESTGLEIYSEAVDRAERATRALPEEANAHYQHAFNLGRYSQGISIAKALTQGLGGKVKASLDRALELAPRHSEAHTALGLYHAEIIDKVGAMVGGLTYGANRESGLEHFEKAVELHPDSAIAKMEYANGLLLMFGDKRIDEASSLYEEAASCEPCDAMERLDVEQAKAELE